MPKYLFTSDQRISELPDRIKLVAKYIQDGNDTAQIEDKSDNNNASTLKFYYNLYAGTETCEMSVSNPYFSIRNFVKKFQFPNPRTSESLANSIEEKTLLAPFRSVVSILHKMANLNVNGESRISLSEILYFVFCNPKVFRNPLCNYDEVIQEIQTTRNQNINIDSKISNLIEWNQYNRQVRELFNVLAHASKCFNLSKGVIIYSKNTPFYQQDKEYINELITYSKFWYPSNPSNFNLSNLEYISYMDTKNIPYSVIDFKLQESHSRIEGQHPLQQIFYGAPGTGKSNTIKREVDEKGKACIRTTFHPDSDYSTFVGCYKPTTKQVPMYSTYGERAVAVKDSKGEPMLEDRIVYEYVGQAFFQAYVEAWKNYAVAEDEMPKEQYLVIEEINRGNCAQIFGDLFQLLDRNDNGFSDYPIKADTDLKKQLAKAFNGLEIAQKDKINALYKNVTDVVAGVLSGDILLLPNNLYIWATMNTSDQSLFPIDSAFKRRWDWQYMPISEGVDNNTGRKLNWKIEAKIETKIMWYDWWEFLNAINSQIEQATNSEDKKLGYFFCKAQNGIIDAKTFVSKVVFYLWNDVFKDFTDETGDLFKDSDGTHLTFNKFYDVDSNGNPVMDSKVGQFLKNLKIEGVEQPDNVSNEEEFDDSDEKGKTNTKDYSKYSINGEEPLQKSPLVKEVVQRYLTSHPEISVDEALEFFGSWNIHVRTFVQSESQYEQRKAMSNDDTKRAQKVEWNDKVIYVSTQWNKDNIKEFMDAVNSRPEFGMTITKVSE